MELKYVPGNIIYQAVKWKDDKAYSGGEFYGLA